MTDDATIPIGQPPLDPPAAPASGGPAPGPAGPPRRRRRLLVAGVAGAVVLLLMLCAGAAVLATGMSRRMQAAERRQNVRDGYAAACVDLERRLNRLVPPGATGDPRQRATAIRNENAAVEPFLAELERLTGKRPDADGRRGRGREARQVRLDGWRQLVDARARYADALEAQAAQGPPAFFLPPRDGQGRNVPDRGQPSSCAAAARRLAAPDL